MTRSPSIAPPPAPPTRRPRPAASALPGLALALGLGLGLAPGGAAAQGEAPGETLRVLNWAGYIDPTILDDFTAETGIAVAYDTYVDSEATEALLVAGGSGYDLVVVGSEYLGRLAEQGAIRPLDLEALPGRARLRADLMARLDVLDPGGRYAVPYLWGTTGVGYDAVAVGARMPDAPVGSWRMIFDPEVVSRFADCGVGVLDAPEEVTSIALAYLGHDPNSSDPADLAAAEAAIGAIAPYVRRFDTEVREGLGDGSLCLALLWSGGAAEARDGQAEGVEIAYSTPEAGAPLWFDTFVVPADAPRAEAAHALIEFVLRPEIVARSTNEVWYPNPNAEAAPHVAPEILADPVIYPSEAAMAGLFAVASRPAAEKAALARAWRRLRLGL